MSQRSHLLTSLDLISVYFPGNGRQVLFVLLSPRQVWPAARLKLKQGFLPFCNRLRGGELKPVPVSHMPKTQEDKQNSYEGKSAAMWQRVGMTAGRQAKVLEACSGGKGSTAMRD